MKKYLCTAAAVILVDQLTKFWIRTNLMINRSIPVLGNLFRLTHIRNSGAAFSMLTGQRVILIAFPIIAIVIALMYMNKHKDSHWSMLLALSLVIGGGLGNLIDRIRLGYVTDMFSLSFFPSVFNVADIAVTAGCMLLIFYILFFMKNE